MFKQVKIILIKTTHPGNIGAVARAMKNMGFRDLTLVSPKYFPSDEAIARASGAADILENACVVETLQEALEDCHFVMGLSARPRTLAWPTLSAKEAALELINTLKPSYLLKAAILFGQEQSGLTNDEIQKCHKQVKIPANPEFPSLNLAQAVQIMTYELRTAFLQEQTHLENLQKETENHNPPKDLVTALAMEGFYQHLEEILIKIQYLNPSAPGQLMEHLRRLYSKASLTQTELNILRGAITAAQKAYGFDNE